MRYDTIQYKRGMVHRNRQCRGWSGNNCLPIFKLTLWEALQKESNSLAVVTKLATRIPLPTCLLEKTKDASQLVMTCLPTIVYQDEDDDTHISPPTQSQSSLHHTLSLVIRSKDCQPIADNAPWQTSLCATCASLTTSMSKVRQIAHKMVDSQSSTTSSTPIMENSPSASLTSTTNHIKKQSSSPSTTTTQLLGDNDGGDIRRVVDQEEESQHGSPKARKRKHVLPDSHQQTRHDNNLHQSAETTTFLTRHRRWPRLDHAANANSMNVPPRQTPTQATATNTNVHTATTADAVTVQCQTNDSPRMQSLLFRSFETASGPRVLANQDHETMPSSMLLQPYPHRRRQQHDQQQPQPDQDQQQTPKLKK